MGRFKGIGFYPPTGFVQLLINHLEYVGVCHGVACAGQVVALVAGQACAVSQGAGRQLPLGAGQEGFPGDPGVNLVILEGCATIGG
ncbi:hypothetical protein D3C84_1101660 [compost metagenome]